jgi:hypothetical protein
MQSIPVLVTDALDEYKSSLLMAKKALPPRDVARSLINEDLKAANTSRLNSLSRFADNPAWRASGNILVGVGAGLTAWSEYDSARDDHHSVAGSAARAGLAGAVDTGISYAAAAQGAEWGAAIGTWIEPGGGTVVGGLIGGAVGALGSVPLTNVFNNAINWL